MFGKTEDWKEMLAFDDKNVLANLIEMGKRHKIAYMHDDEKVLTAQLWCALIEMKKEIDSMKGKLANANVLSDVIIEKGNLAKKESVKSIVANIFGEEKAEQITENILKM